MITCPKCQKDLEEGVSFCSYCGEKIGGQIEPRRNWQFWALSIITLVFIIGIGGYFWFINISSAEKLAVEKYLPVQGKIESRFNANIRNDQYKDVVVLVTSQEKPLEQYLSVISFDVSKLKWEVIYEKTLSRYAKANVEICKLVPGDKDQILVRFTPQGTGAFIDYYILGWQNNEMKTFLDRKMLPMGKIEIQGNQLLETSTSGNRIYKWSENAFVATTLASDPVKPTGSNDFVVEYQIIDDKTVRISQSEVNMFVGQSLRFVCNSKRRAARIMSSGVNTLEYKDGVYIAKTPSDTTIQILPTYGDWENAAKVHVIIKAR